MELGQSQQVSLGRQDLPEPIAKRRTQITGLAALLSDDQSGNPGSRSPSNTRWPVLASSLGRYR
jgi:hypothetical protein